MRLINGDLINNLPEDVPDQYKGKEADAYLDGIGYVLKSLDNLPDIDPETLPIVQELRKELKRVTAERNAALKWVKQLKAEKAAAIGELSGVLASVDALTEFVDDEVHPVVDYDLYSRLRDKVDVITQWEHADEWA